MVLVSKNIAPSTNSMIATVPPITFVKYNIPIMAAIITLIILSAVPIFFIIIRFLIYYELNSQNNNGYQGDATDANPNKFNDIPVHGLFV